MAGGGRFGVCFFRAWLDLLSHSLRVDGWDRGLCEHAGDHGVFRHGLAGERVAHPRGGGLRLVVCLSGEEEVSASLERIAQDLDGVLVPDGAALGLGEPTEVHEARHVHPDQEIRVDVEDVIEFERAHPARDVREGHTEGAAKATALLGLAEGNHAGIADGT